MDRSALNRGAAATDVCDGRRLRLDVAAQLGRRLKTATGSGLAPVPLHSRMPEVIMANPLPAGTSAPDFALPRTPDQKLSLEELRGRPVVLAFYPADWSPVCGDQMALYNEMMNEFAPYKAQLLGISVDGPWCHGAFASARKLQFPLLADFEPKGAVARRYGVYREREGVSERALFLIDHGGKIAWSYVSPISVNPGADGILEALDQLCPGDAQRGGGHRGVG
ncbi:MAG TPA: redoxin domain-containing protein [Polyangiaceae bacterium]|jgi:peroxiredoxin|nr:redoxin domain-containing protein [Polyangiaceae bacterium]